MPWTHVEQVRTSSSTMKARSSVLLSSLSTPHLDPLPLRCAAAAMRDIKVTIIGDSGVGKSSLVTSLVKDSFSPRVQAVVPEILLPLDVTDAGVTTRIVDTSSCSSGTGGSGGASGSSSNSGAGLAERRAHLEASLRSADVVLLVYDVARPTTFDRIPTYWLPYLRSLIGSSTSGKHVPVILVGNKIDARVEAGSSSGAGDAATTNENLEEELAPVMAEFGEVESCIETSVKEGVNVSEVFYFAQKVSRTTRREREAEQPRRLLTIFPLPRSPAGRPLPNRPPLRRQNPRPPPSLHRSAQTHLPPLRLGQGPPAERRGAQRVSTKMLR